MLYWRPARISAWLLGHGSKCAYVISLFVTVCSTTIEFKFKASGLAFSSGLFVEGVLSFFFFVLKYEHKITKTVYNPVGMPLKYKHKQFYNALRNNGNNPLKYNAINDLFTKYKKLEEDHASQEELDQVWTEFRVVIPQRGQDKKIASCKSLSLSLCMDVFLFKKKNLSLLHTTLSLSAICAFWVSMNRTSSR